MGTHLECIYSTLRASQAKKAEENLFLHITTLVMVRKGAKLLSLADTKVFLDVPRKRNKGIQENNKE